MSKKKIADYAGMASREAHEEYMSLDGQQLAYYFKDILEEQIDKFDRLQAMANQKWYHKLFK